MKLHPHEMLAIGSFSDKTKAKEGRYKEASVAQKAFCSQRCIRACQEADTLSNYINALSVALL